MTYSDFPVNYLDCIFTLALACNETLLDFTYFPCNEIVGHSCIRVFLPSQFHMNALETSFFITDEEHRFHTLRFLPVSLVH